MGTRRSFGTGRYHVGEKDMVITDVDYAGGGPLVIVSHGFFGSANDYAEPDKRRDLDILAGRGCVVISADLGGGSTWADDTYLARVGEYRSYAEADWGVDPDAPIGLIGDSMGAMGSANYHWRHPAEVGCSVLRLPVVCADLVHDRDPTGLGAAMDAAYGGDWDGNKADRDPLANAELISAFGRNVLIYYSTNDPVVLPSDITTFTAAAWPVRAVSLGPVAHDPALVYPRIPARRQANWIMSRLS